MLRRSQKVAVSESVLMCICLLQDRKEIFPITSFARPQGDFPYH